MLFSLHRACLCVCWFLFVKTVLCQSDEADPCPVPAKDGTTFRLQTDVPDFNQTFQWRRPETYPHSGIELVVSCTKEPLQCTSQLEENEYRGTIEKFGGGYRLTLVIGQVDRVKDGLVWSWYHETINKPVVLGRCALDVYHYSSPVQCEEVGLSDTGTPFAPAFSVYWSCHITDVYPATRCLFEYKQDYKKTFSPISSDHVTELQGKVLPSGNYAYNTCFMKLAVGQLGLGTFQLRVTMYPEVQLEKWRLTVGKPYQTVSLSLNHCSSPAKEGFAHKIIMSTFLRNTQFLWNKSQNESSERTLIARCSSSALGCNTLRQSPHYTSTITQAPNGLYTLTLSIDKVTRDMDQAVWGVYQQNTNESSPVLMEQCQLPVYSYESYPECDEIQLQNLGTDNSPHIAVVWTCRISNIFPRPTFEFSYKSKQWFHFRKISSDHVTDLSNLTENEIPGHTTKYEFVLKLPLKFTYPSAYTFKVAIFPIINGIPISLDIGMQSNEITIRQKSATGGCYTPKLVNNGNDMELTCQAPGSHYTSFICTFSQWYSSKIYNTFTGKATAICSGHPPDCTNTCLMRERVTSIGIGTYYFLAFIQPVLDPTVVDTTSLQSYQTSNSAAIKFKHPKPILRNCPSGEHVSSQGYLKAGTSATCECYLGDPGFPIGRLVWLHSDGREASQTTSEASTTLTITYNASNPKPEFRCIGKSQLGQGNPLTYTAQYAYGPKRVYINMSGKKDVALRLCTSSLTYTIYCHVPTDALNGYPNFNAILREDGRQFLKASRAYTSGGEVRFQFPVSITSEGVKNFTCVASNLQFPDFVAEESGTVTVQMPPRSPPSWSVDNGPLFSGSTTISLVQGQMVAVSCHAKGGYPPVSSVTITCGDRHSMQEGVKATFPLQVVQSMHDTECSCSAQHVSGCAQLTSVVKLDVRYIQLNAFTVRNEIYDVRVMDGQTVRLSCSAEGLPPPVMSIRRERHTLPVESPNQVTAINVDKPFGCADTGNYTCTAENVAGVDTKTIAVYVTCSPQLPGPNQHPQHYKGETGKDLNISIDVIGYPEPKTFILTEGNSTLGRAKRAVSLGKITHEVVYTPRGPSEGSVRLGLSDLHQEDSGHYTLTISNGVGEALMYSFGIDVSLGGDYGDGGDRIGGSGSGSGGGSGGSGDDDDDDGGGGGGSLSAEVVVGIVASVAVVLLVVVFIIGMKVQRWRQGKGQGKCQGDGQGKGQGRELDNYQRHIAQDQSDDVIGYEQPTQGMTSSGGAGNGNHLYDTLTSYPSTFVDPRS